MVAELRGFYTSWGFPQPHGDVPLHWLLSFSCLSLVLRVEGPSKAQESEVQPKRRKNRVSHEI